MPGPSCPAVLVDSCFLNLTSLPVSPSPQRAFIQISPPHFCHLTPSLPSFRSEKLLKARKKRSGSNRSDPFIFKNPCDLGVAYQKPMSAPDKQHNLAADSSRRWKGMLRLRHCRSHPSCAGSPRPTLPPPVSFLPWSSLLHPRIEQKYFEECFRGRLLGVGCEG